MGKDKSYWDYVKPTYIENWPPSLHSLSIASINIPLSLEETNLIIYQFAVNNGEDVGVWPKEIALELINKIDFAIKQFPPIDGTFIRLGSRSPKDSWEGIREGFCCHSGGKAYQLLTYSERIEEDLRLARQELYEPKIWVREWLYIPKWSEFRLFIKDKKLIGLSWYNHFDKIEYPETDYPKAISWAIQQWFPYFQGYTHLDDVVCDVSVKPRINNKERMWEVKMIEINPFFEMTDPCLFSWEELHNIKEYTEKILPVNNVK